GAAGVAGTSRRWRSGHGAGTRHALRPAGARRACAARMPPAVASLTLGQLALRFGCTLRGDPQRPIDGVAGLSGGPRSLGFLANPVLRAGLRDTRLGAVVIQPRHAGDCPVDALLHANPHAT